MLRGGTTVTTTTTTTTHPLRHQISGDVMLGASPINSHSLPPPPPAGAFDEVGPAPDDDAIGRGGNRWPRQETLDLLKIRSEMDAEFRDSPIKAPLWEHVSRKLGGMGYRRSAKKCKEKFENVHKYYKRIKEARDSRQDGKSYRFFNQLEALQITNTISTPVMPLATTTDTTNPAVTQISLSSSELSGGGVAIGAVSAPAIATAGNNFSSSTESSSSDGVPSNSHSDMGSRKRKRRSSGSHKMMDFLQRLMKQMLEKQEAMQQRFLDTIHKREHDWIIGEDAWKRQEMARLTHQHQIMTKERATTSASLIALLHQIPSQITIPLLTQPVVAPISHHQPQNTEIIQHKSGFSAQVIMAVPEQQYPPPRETRSFAFDPMSSRWPKAEVVALVNLRSGLESRYQEAGSKGPLWEEISVGMKRMGYQRSAKRCKEKWENINKYYKKVKDSNKIRPQDAKTCPYFNQLHTLYRKKHQLQTIESNETPLAIMPPPPPAQASKSESNNNTNNNEGLPPMRFFEKETTSAGGVAA